MKKLILFLVISLCASTVFSGADLDGSNDYIRCGTTGIPTAYPMSVMVRLDGTTVDNSRNTSGWAISDFSDANNFAFLGLTSDVSTEARARFIVRSGASFNKIDGTTDIDGDDDVTLIGVATNSTSRDVYTNGTDKQTSTVSTSYSTNLDRQTIGIVARDSAYTTDPFQGTFREVAVWDVALTEAEVVFLSNTHIRYAPLQVRPDNLTLYVVMDAYSEGDDLGTSGLTFKDLSPNGVTCTANGGSSLIAKDETKLSYP